MHSTLSLRGAFVLCASLGAAQLPAQTPATPVSPGSGTVTLTPATPVAPSLTAGPASQARLINLSTRARVTASTPLITGFAISGSAPRTVLVRGVGPSLLTFGVNDALALPRLRVFDAQNNIVADNAGWAANADNVSAVTAAAVRTGAFPFANNAGKDSAVVLTLAPGSYTVHVSSSDDRGGVALAEVYDASDGSTDSRLVNISTRAFVAPNGGEVISGFVLAGTAPRQFLVRGIGPGLTRFGVGDAMVNPAVSIWNAAGVRLAFNDDWNGGGTAVTVATTASQGATGTVTNDPRGLGAAAQSVGAFTLDAPSRDAALLVTLAPGAYTAQVAGGFDITTSAVSLVTPANPNDPASAVATAIAQTAIASISIFPSPSVGTALLEIYEVP